MKYLGVDYGSKWVGIAISDDEGKIAFPRAEVENNEELLPLLSRIVEQEHITSVVVGDTRSHGGAANPVTAEAETFIEKIARETGLPVSRAFEAWSSIEASRYAPKGEEHNNAAAAAIILQRFLDMGARSGGHTSL